MSASMTPGQGTMSIAVDAASLRAALRALNRAGKEPSAEMRAESKGIASWLVGKLMMAAESSSAPPQARLVAASGRAKSDRVVTVEIGGTKKVGRAYRDRKTKRSVRAAAGALLWGSEHGSRTKPARFVRPYRDRGYWIEPTIETHAREAVERWNTALRRVLTRAGWSVA